MAALPPVNELKYNKEKLGYFGELGNGAFARIRFLQSAVTKEELDNITLIENIPGSEKWDIRDLFQRDVDMARDRPCHLEIMEDGRKSRAARHHAARRLEPDKPGVSRLIRPADLPR